MGQIVKTIESIQITSYDNIHKQERTLPPNRTRIDILKNELVSDFTSLVQDAFFKEIFQSPLASSSPTRINITLRIGVITVTNKTTGVTRQFRTNHNQKMASTNQIISQIFAKTLAAVKNGPAAHPTHHTPSLAPPPQQKHSLYSKKRPPAITIAPRTVSNPKTPNAPSTPFSRGSMGKLMNTHAASSSPTAFPPLSKGSAARTAARPAQTPILSKKGLSPSLITKVTKSSQPYAFGSSPPSASSIFQHSLNRPARAPWVEEEFSTTYTAYPCLFSKDSYGPKQRHLPLQAKKKSDDVFDPFAMKESPHLTKSPSNSQERTPTSSLFSDDRF